MALEDEEVARDRAALERLVAKYDLRWEHVPAKPYPVRYDFIGEGWSELVENLIVELIDLGWDRQVAQVKEKFGELRFYIGVGTDEMFAAISRGERRSVRVCNRCGRRGRRRRSGQVVVRCDEHAPGSGPAPALRRVCSTRVLVPGRKGRRRS